jgi:flotillin
VSPVLIIVIVAVIGVLALMWLVGSLYRRVGPNRALIVYGFGGHSIVTSCRWS